MDVYRALFSAVLNMSVTGGIVILLVMLARLFLQRVPRKYSYLLWGVVLLRLLCPFSFSSVLSVFQVMHVPVTEQGRIEYVPRDSVRMEIQEVVLPAVAEKEVPAAVGDLVVPSVDSKAEPVRRSWSLWAVAGIVWMAGIAALWTYSLLSMVRLGRQLTGAVQKEKNIYLCDYIETAFVLGVFRPRIYLPTKLAGTEREYILLHEQTHIRRADHIFRLLAFLALSIHWFNPLVWCAFRLSERDMEMSCDEAVMGKMGAELRTAYSASLLNIASGRQVIGGAPLGFGEGNVKCRIQNVMRYRKSAAWIAVPVLAVVVFLFVAFGSNPARSNAQEIKQTDGRSVTSLQRKGKLTELSYADGDADGVLGVQQSDGQVGEAPGDQSGKTSGGQGGGAPGAQEPDGGTDAQQNGILDVKQIAVTRPVITEDLIYGTDPAELDYADEKTVIFHGFFGLFVYDRSEGKLIGAVDLAPIGCNMTQGDAYCDVKVAKDGQKVYLHPLNIEDMYVYDVPGCSLIMTKYDVKGVEMFDGLKPTGECVDPRSVSATSSAFCVQDDHGRCLYLEQKGSALVNDLYLVEQENNTEVGYIQLFCDYNEREPEEQHYLAYIGYTGYLDECKKWSDYERFLDQDYDGDGLTDRVYQEDGMYNISRYRIEFGNGDLIETEWLDGGVPYVETCDLNGDGRKEILLRLPTEYSTNPKYYGAMALFEKKKDGYELLLPPEEVRLTAEEASRNYMDGYQPSTPCIVLEYEVLGEAEVRVKIRGMGDKIDQRVLMNKEMWWSYVYFDTEKEHYSVCYDAVIVEQGDKDILEFHFEVFNKWYEDEIVVTAEYEDGKLRVADCRYVSED